MTDAVTKRCPKCGAGLPLEAFNKDKSHSYGRASYCRECNRNKANQWSSENKDRKRELGARYRQENREKLLAGKKIWYWENRQHSIKKSMEWKNENKERKTELDRQYYIKNAHIIKRRAAEWAKAHPLGDRSRAHNRRCAGGLRINRHIVVGQYWEQNGLCYWCMDELGERFHIDHYVPVSRGGTNHKNNIVCACPECNQRRGARLDSEWKREAYCFW